MTDERAKEIAEELREKISRLPDVKSGVVDAADLCGLTLKLYDDLQAIKQAMQGLSFLGVGGGIKPVTKTDG